MTLVYDTILKFIQNGKTNFHEICDNLSTSDYLNQIELNILSDTLVTIKNSKSQVCKKYKIASTDTIYIYDEISNIINTIVKISDKYYFVTKFNVYQQSNLDLKNVNETDNGNLAPNYSKIKIYPEIEYNEYIKLSKYDYNCDYNNNYGNNDNCSGNTNFEIIAYIGNKMHQYSSLLQIKSNIYDSDDNCDNDSNNNKCKILLKSVINPMVYNLGDYNEEVLYNNLTKCNVYQQNILKLLKNNIEIIHGPPGTGKTTTILNIMKAKIPLNHRILCTAVQNQAIESIVINLMNDKDFKNNFVVFGDSKRLKKYSVNYQIDKIYENNEHLQKIKKKIDKYENMLELLNNPDLQYDGKSNINTIDEISKKLQEYEKKYSVAKAKILENIKIFISTIESSHRIYNSVNNSIDTIIVDEAGATSEMQLFPLFRLKPKNIILVGDHKQLSSFTYSNNNKISSVFDKKYNPNYIKSLLERMVVSNRTHHILQLQYRMHESICKLVSKLFYNKLLYSDESCISKYEGNIEWINIVGKTQRKETSLYNVEEINKIDNICKNYQNEKILILTPYNCQLDLLKDKLCFQKNNIICKSIDSCQGMESNVVIISLVKSNCNIKSNSDFATDFVTDPKRICVALSRAKNKLIIVGDQNAFKNNEIWKKVIAYINKINQ